MNHRIVIVAGVGLVTALAACSAIIGTRDLTLEGGDGGEPSVDGSSPGADGTVGTPVGDGAGGGGDVNQPGNEGGNGGDASCNSADLQTDPHNCGTCGHDCLKGGCNAGVCQAFTLVAGQTGAVGIAVDATSVYWANWSNGQILKANKDGTGLTILAIDQGNLGGDPYDLTLDTNNVYWTDQGGPDLTDTASGFVGSCPKSGGDGGVPLTPDDLSFVEGLAVDTAHVYWGESENGAIGQLNRADGGIGYLVAGLNGASEVADDDASVFFTTAYTMQKSPKGAPLVYGDPFEQATDAAVLTTYYSSGIETDPYGITLDATNVYWVVEGAGLIQYAPRTATGTVTPTTLSGTEVNPVMIAVDATNVYWTAEGPNTASPSNAPVYLSGYVATCPKTGCPAAGPTKLATGLAAPYGVAVDDSAIYFTLDGNIPNPTTGSVMKIVK